MNVTLLKALVALLPACMLFLGSVVLFFRGKTVCSFLQLLGAGCLIIVVLTHVFEALHLFPWMHLLSNKISLNRVAAYRVKRFFGTGRAFFGLARFQSALN